MTTNINEQVERMASLMEQMVTLMNESADHANESIRRIIQSGRDNNADGKAVRRS